MSAPAAGPFGPVQRIAAGVLDVGYVDIGPPGGRAVLLLHGWPYDIYSYADAAPALAATGYRVIVPYCSASTPTCRVPLQRTSIGRSSAATRRSRISQPRKDARSSS